jgi:ATP/maltotriose-dependent transcriptional regulator MalT/DNA-binding SARP family transcriptional activator
MSSTSPGALEARPEAAKGSSIPRERLASRLGAALDAGSVVITAGAGSGKTTALDQAVRRAGMPVVWIACSDAERAAGSLLMRIVSGVAEAAPGASDALAERLAVGIERVDALATTRELIAELSRLLVEPLVLVVDDAEHLDGSGDSLSLLSELIRAEFPQLHVAVASRRPLDLKLAKPRAAGRLTELAGADLAFDADECGALLRTRSGLEFTPEQVDRVMDATEGWPLGIALAALLTEPAADGGAALSDLVAAPDLREYLSEELLDSLDPELRSAAIRTGAVRVVSPAVLAALDLPADLGARLEGAGMLVRRVDDGDSFAYHPLVREILAERLTSGEAGDLLELHAAVAPVVAESGDAIGAIEHWLVSESWPEAVAAIEREGPYMLRTSPELMESWLALLPGEVQATPAIQTLQGQLEWGAGQHEHAAAPLREAVAGHREAGEADREWLARYFLCEALFSAGEFEEMTELAEDWDSPQTPRRNSSAAGVAWYKVLALTALARYDEADKLADRLRLDERAQRRFSYIDELATLVRELSGGGAEQALARQRETIQELERNDPMGRLPVAVAVIALVHLDIGEVDAALAWLDQCERESDRLGLGFIARDAHLQRAMLLARRGDLTDAELELERAGARQGTGWRGVSRPSAEAIVADARGDAGEAVDAARRALDRVRPGLVCFRVWTAIDMATVLAQNGSLDAAREAVADGLAALDEHFPGDAGSYHRARLLGARAWLAFESGDREGAYESLRAAWSEAGENARHLARAQWTSLRPILWQALADEALEPDAFLPALGEAFSDGEALIAFTDHPRVAVRRAVLPVALAANHPAVLSQLEELVGDDDSEVAASAEATRGRLKGAPPPLRFRLFGGFRVFRASWGIAEESWGRPIDARLVRFLLVQDGLVSEDVIFEALWPDLTAASARRSLQVSVSRVRQVLDLPFAEDSVVESRDRSYRLKLTGQDTVDTEDFRAAANAALETPERAPLERARALWGGEPLADERYSDWAAPYRERLTDRYIAVLTGLIELHARSGAHAHQVDAARELVDLDPLNEEGHRALIAAYARSGRRGHALRQYLECRRALVEQLGVEPEEATSRLQARILAGEPV